MIHVPITLGKPATLNNNTIPVSVSIPFSNGVLTDQSKITLADKNQQAIDKQIDILAYWPNKSIKWMRIHFYYAFSSSKTTIYLTDKINNKSNHSVIKAIKVIDKATYFEILTGKVTFQLMKDELGIFSKSANELKLFKSQHNSLILTDEQNKTHTPFIDEITFDYQNTARKLQIKATINGTFKNLRKAQSTKFSAEITFYAEQAYTKWNITLHNPNCMSHSGGTWDMGNEHSQFFNSFNALITTPINNDFKYQLRQNAHSDSVTNNWFAAKNNLTIFQASSGGKNWQSENHINAKGMVPMAFNGYKISIEDHNKIISDRASPLVYIEENKLADSGVSVHIKDFWQKFPKSIEVNSGQIVLGLFPLQASTGFELQPGEKKSDTFYINYQGDAEALSHFISPVQVTICPQYLASTNAIPFFTEQNNEENYNNIINDGLYSSNNFFQKRELIDEFGWRNFGDLYADHETLEADCDGELISHYNNQYDPLYGFLRQYLLSNDTKWLTLANDLADHIKNIDLYHTTLDKAEYNGGLFWHTDHYLPAETASHRTYSTLHKNDAYQDHAGGGGPGGQHCYTNGLMLHYFLTGEETSKQAVLQLTKWITHVYEGSGTITDFLLAIKNQKRLDVKDIYTGKYPLDRGTGHYIIALIDSFELTGKQSYLDRASLIIKSTIHPKDNIDNRNLDNVEESWFYTILLQAVYRYLFAKKSITQFDLSFNYAKESLIHYAQWMCENEHPYLDKPKILEYPNHTWAAQDIRKANVLYMASYFSTNKETQKHCKAKADTIYNYVIQMFSKEPTRSFTRILSILMQNHGIKSYVEHYKESGIPEKTTLLNDINLENESLSNKKNSHLLGAFWSTLSNTSLSQELSWLRRRSKGMDRFLAKLGK